MITPTSPTATTSRCPNWHTCCGRAQPDIGKMDQLRERRCMSQSWKLVGPDGMPYTSAVPGTLGGHRRTRIYGRLDCPAALRAIARGGYVSHRVFFLTEEHARAAGYRPCAVCLPLAYARWKAQQDDG